MAKRYSDVYSPKRAELNLTDTVAVKEYLIRHRFDVVIHSAITTTSVEQNLQMYFNLEHCSDAYGKLLNIGSGAEYDMNHYVPRMKEDYFGEHIPSDSYGFSKYVIAKDIEGRRRNIYNLRLFGIYGKYENYKRRFISNNICRVLSNLPISINRNMFFDYLYIEDFLKIVEKFIHGDPRERTYNICTGNRIDLLALGKMIKGICGREVPIVVKQEGWNPEYSGDNTRFLKEFSEFSFTEPLRAITELYAWYRDASKIVFDPKEFNS